MSNPYLARIRALEARIISLESYRLATELRPSLREKDLAVKFSCTVRTIQRMIKDGRLPKPTYICGPMWSAAQLDNYFGGKL